MKQILFILGLLILSATQASADDTDKTGIAEGAGTYTCGEFGRFYANDPSSEKLFFSWAQGFMTGVNLSISGQTGNHKNLDTKSSDDQMTDIRRYCDAHPLGFYLDAAMDLFHNFPFAIQRTKQGQ